MNSSDFNFSKQTSRFIVLVLLSILLLIGDRTGLISPLRGFFEQFLFPLKSAVNYWGVSGGQFMDVIANFQSEKGLQTKVGRVEKENNELKVENQRLILENNSLRKQLEAPLPPSWRFTPAAVLGISRYMQIWGGQESGIRSGMNVVDGKILIGRIISVTVHSASVILPTDPDISISAISARGARGKVIGQFGERVVFDKVLQKDPLFLDDIILTAGDDGYPPGLLIGKVKNIDAKDIEAYKKAELVPAIPYNRETTVFVVTGT